MLLFPLDGLLDEQACHDWLLNALHPAGLSCPRGHRLPEGQRPHDRHRVSDIPLLLSQIMRLSRSRDALVIESISPEPAPSRSP